MSKTGVNFTGITKQVLNITLAWFNFHLLHFCLIWVILTIQNISLRNNTALNAKKTNLKIQQNCYLQNHAKKNVSTGYHFSNFYSSYTSKIQIEFNFEVKKTSFITK